MASQVKKAAFTGLQISFTVAVLYMLLRDEKTRAVISKAMTHANYLWLLIGIAAYGVVELIAGYRWHLLLKVQGIILSKTRLWTLLLIGVFFNFFIPGGTGGDVVKIFYLVKEAPGKGAAAVLSVLVDRIIGLFALILMAVAFICVRWHWLTATEQTTRYVWTALVVLAVAVAAVAFSFVVTGFGLVHRLPARFPGRDKLAEVAMAYSLYGRAWPTSLLALGTSIVAHIGYIFVFYCAARAYSTPTIHVPTFAEMCFIMPLINTIASLPISFGGLGVREGLFQVFFSELAGVEKGVAFLISSTGFLLSAVWGAVGGVLYLFYRPTEHARLVTISEEVAELEHHVAEDEIAMEISEEEKEEEAAKHP